MRARARNCRGEPRKSPAFKSPSPTGEAYEDGCATPTGREVDTSHFFRGKPLNADVIAGGIKADEVRIRAMGHDFEWLLMLDSLPPCSHGRRQNDF